MRTDLALSHLSVHPGQSARFEVDVTNTVDVIDGITAIIDGINPTWVRLEQPTLNLFPDASDRLDISIDIPLNCPAGVYLVVIRLESLIDDTRASVHDLWLTVEPRVAFDITLTPSIVTGGNFAHLQATVTNTGNTDAPLTVTAFEPTRHVDVAVRQEAAAVRFGGEATVGINLRAKRPWFGQPTPHSVVITARSGETEVHQTATFMQKPRIPRGVLTALMLVGIIALWATILLLALRAFSSEPVLAKAVSKDRLKGVDDIPLANIDGSAFGEVTAATTGLPLPGMTVTAYRFVVAQAEAPVATRTIRTDGLAERISPRPASLRPVAAVITDEDGSFAVEALIPGTYKFKASADGFNDVWFVSESAVTGAPVTAIDGLTGVVLIDADPTLTDEASRVPIDSEALDDSAEARRVEEIAASRSTAVRISPDSNDPGVDARQTRGRPSIGFALTGELGSFSGVVALPLDAQGEPVSAAAVNLTATATLLGAANDTTDESASTDAAATVAIEVSSPDSDDPNATSETADDVPGATSPEEAWKSGTVEPDGTVTFEGVPTPGTVQVTITGDNFETQRFEQQLDGGERSVFNTVRLLASAASISGTVTDRETGTGLGDVVVTARSGEREVSVTTPTRVNVAGQYEIVGLATPDTYIVTFQRDGYTSVTQSIRLEAGGADAEPLDVQLTGGLGTISGRTVAVTEGITTPIGGITVEVTGPNFRTETSSLTSVTTGSFSVSDLPVEQTYIIELRGDGLQTETLSVTVPPNGVTPPLGDITMSSASARIAGTVRDAANNQLVAATVTLCDGERRRSTTSVGDPAGFFAFEDVALGTYTLSVEYSTALISLPTMVTLVRVTGVELPPLNLQLLAETPDDDTDSPPARCGTALVIDQ